MPKANHGGATAAGMTGIVEHGAPLADGRTLSELDPEVNLDGTLIEGEHPDHPKEREREVETLRATQDTAPAPITPDEDEESDEESEGDKVREEELSPGNNSATSSKTTVTTRVTGSKRR